MAGSFLPKLMRYIDHELATKLRIFRRGYITGQGTSTKVVRARLTGETVADGFDYPVILPYSSSVIGSQGGPAVDDDVLFVYTSPGNPAALGRLTTSGSTPPIDPVYGVAWDGPLVAGSGMTVKPGPKPALRPTVVAVTGTGLNVGFYTYAFSYVSADGESGLSPNAVVITDADHCAVSVTVPAEPDATRTDITAVKLYRNANGRGEYKLVTTLSAPTSSQAYTDVTPDASLGAVHAPDKVTLASSGGLSYNAFVSHALSTSGGGNGKISPYYTSASGDNLAWGIGVSGSAEYDHALGQSTDVNMQAADGFSQVFSILPFDNWRVDGATHGYNDYGGSIAYANQYQGPGVHMQLDGDLTMTGGIRAGKAILSPGTKRATYNASHFIFGGFVQLGYDATDETDIIGTLWQGNGTATFTGAATFNGGVTISGSGNSLSGTYDASAHNIVTDTTTGTQIATATTQKIAFYGATPVVRPTSTSGAVTAGATYGATERAMLNDAYSAMRTLGLLS